MSGEYIMISDARIAESTESEMLSEKDKKWISDAFAPKGWRRAYANIIAIGSPAAIISAIIAALAFGGGAIYYSSAHVEKETQFRADTIHHFEQIESRLASLVLQAIENQPNKFQNQNDAKEILAQARSNKIPPIPTSQIERVGIAFVDARKRQDQQLGTRLSTF